MPLPIRIDNLLLRRVCERDFIDMFAYYGHPEVARYQFWEPFTEEQVSQLIASQLEMPPGETNVPLLLAVEWEDEHRVIGDCSITITSIDDRQAEVGFVFHPRYHGRGFATRAVHAAVGYAFRELGMRRIVAATDVRNERSWKLLERIGMRREGQVRRDSRVKGEWVDDFIYAMRDDEWPAR